jgi:hypothetical protein
MFEGGQAALPFRVACGKPLQDANAPHALALLRTRYQRPSDRTGQ